MSEAAAREKGDYGEMSCGMKWGEKTGQWVSRGREMTDKTNCRDTVRVRPVYQCTGFRLARNKGLVETLHH